MVTINNANTCGDIVDDDGGNCDGNNVNDNELANCLCSIAPHRPLPVLLLSIPFVVVVVVAVFASVKYVEASNLNRIFIQIITQQVII